MRNISHFLVVLGFGVLTAAPVLAQDKLLELVIEGRRDWNLEGLMNTRKGAFALHAGMAKGLPGMANAKASGSASQTDKLTVTLVPDGKGGLSGTGIWDAVSQTPAGIFGNRTSAPVTVKGLKPVLRGKLAAASMVLPIDMVLQGPDITGSANRQTVYMHLDVTLPYRAGAAKVLEGADDYGRFAYRALLRPSTGALTSAPVLDDAGLCAASIAQSHAKLQRSAVAAQCGCFVPKFRASLSASDYDGWKQMMVVSTDRNASSAQKGGDIIALMARMGQGWTDRVDAADRGAQKTCAIKDWN